MDTQQKYWLVESYKKQSREIWPGRGQHILAQFDEDSILVYQAYKKDIADWAVQYQRFSGCPDFSDTRMTWIKTNFLWMMFRSKWGSSPNQDHILAIWLKIDAFEKYLRNARTRGFFFVMNFLYKNLLIKIFSHYTRVRKRVQWNCTASVGS
eukprot:TRINITY_DN7631_c0_g1_i4.p2 TRINITY_DN7631_c0_g1~~TRINITY_DN7631_c0_g1_i4.p2  ORF type:complete len:152 (+),score=21.24 TRINITY_DN7631_c0_g1_i4:71-526(+)